MAMGYHLQAKQKSAQAFHIPKGCFMAQALVSVDAGSGASIFTRVSCPHRLHLRGRWWQVLSGLTGRIFPFPQIGQRTHPFFTTSLPRSLYAIKPFSLHLDPVRKYSLGFKNKKSLSKIKALF